jgi:2-oxoglutarate dehydrogenase E2 component (dihydrolipoamide succinyltransferase)
MATEIRVPTLGESVSEATIGRWFKKAGDAVKADEPLCELETDKVTLEVNAPAAGVLAEIIAKDGETVEPGALLGQITEGGAAAKSDGKKPDAKTDAKAEATPPAETPKAAPAASRAAAASDANGSAAIKGPSPMPPAPSAAKTAADRGIDPADVEGTGRRGQVMKGDILAHQPAQAKAPEKPAPIRAPSPASDADREERVKMTKLRQTIARRLKEAQATAAMLTTFNEVDMTEVMALRSKYKDVFEKKHGAKLGFMGFFVKACVQALKDVPAVNAEIDGTDLIYKNYYHLGIAVGTDKGLVVPVVRDCDHLGLAGIEKTIAGLGKSARDGKLKIEDMQGGTFTITNGGIYGSLMSTPILNAPQSGILGMHKIQERPMAVGGKIEIRPMMYLALSYDHRIVDGKEAVTFLVRVKEALEDPARLVLDL